MNAKCFATLTIIILVTALNQPLASAKVGLYRNMPSLTSRFSDVVVQPFRFNPSQQAKLEPPATGTPDGRRTPGGSHVTKSN